MSDANGSANSNSEPAGARSSIGLTVRGAALEAQVVAASYAEVERFAEFLFSQAAAIWPLDHAASLTADAAKEVAAAAPAKKRGYTLSAGDPPADSFDAKVLAAWRAGTRDTIELADLFDKTNGIISISLARLRKRGCLGDDTT